MSPPSFSPVEEIKQKLDIIDVVSEYVQLKPGGANWKARCPFHHEKTPSFTVNRDRQIFHCFGCGKGGDVFTFIQEIEGMEFPEALRLLAKKAGVQLPAFDPKLQNQKTKLLDVVKAAQAHFRELFERHAEGKAARDYLAKRSVSADIIDAFGLGYSLNSWDDLSGFLKRKGFKDEDVFLAGLTVKKDRGEGQYDRFRGRLIFPIRDVHGTIVGFAGRVLPDSAQRSALSAQPQSGGGEVESTQAKYVNSPETLIYKKGSIVYALDRAKQAIRETKAAVLVEGYMDVLASHQAGVENVVATSGTALTRDQLRLLRRSTTTLLLAFDTDVAGEDAAKRGIDLALQEEFSLKVVTLPEGKDPDELIKKDPNAWKQALVSAQSIMDYYFSSVFAKNDLKKVEGKKEAARVLLPVIAKIGNPIEQTHYLQQLAEALKVDESILRSRLPKPKTVPKTADAAPAPAARKDRAVLLAERILSLALRDAERFGETLRQLEPWMIPDERLARLYKTAVLYYSERRSLDERDFHNHLETADADLVPLLDVLHLLAEREFGEASEPAHRQELANALAALRRDAITRELKRVTDAIRTAERAHDATTLAQLTERFQQLTADLRT